MYIMTQPTLQKKYLLLFQVAIQQHESLMQLKN